MTDAGGGTLPGISQFERIRGGLYWWKSGASTAEVGRREGPMAVNAAPGIRAPQVALRVVNRYQGQGYTFSVDGVVRDDHDIYDAANGVLPQKPLASTFTNALALAQLSAEWMIVDALLGGWDRRTPVALVHLNPSSPQKTHAFGMQRLGPVWVETDLQGF